MDEGEIRKAIFEGRGVVEIHEMDPNTSVSTIKTIRLEMIEEGLPIVSPFGLVQERVNKDDLHEWRIVTICCLMNRTHARQVRPMMRDLFVTWPTPEAMVVAGPGLEVMLKTLGLVKKRANVLRKMSEDLVKGVPIERCFGVGHYAHDSLEIFVNARTNFVPTDRFLVKYVDWVNEGRRT